MILASEVLENRRKWIEYLRAPGRKKFDGGWLADPEDGESRCCLGHACVVLGIPGEYVETIGLWRFNSGAATAPYEVNKLLGLHSSNGGLKFGGFGSLDRFAVENGFTYTKPQYKGQLNSLASLNDATDITPAAIGDYLESVIEGGDETPFRALSEYPITAHLK